MQLQMRHPHGLPTLIVDNPTKGEFVRLVEKDLNQMEEDLDFTQIQSPVLSALQVCNLNIQRYNILYMMTKNANPT